MDPTAPGADPEVAGSPTGIAAASALAHPSRRRIADALAGAPDGLTVTALAGLVGLHHNAIRQHLQTMAAAGLVQVSRDAPRGRGRPSDRYRLVDPGAPQRAAHEELVAMLMGLVERAGLSEEQVAAIGRERGLATAAAGQGDAAAAVTQALARLGFAPREVSRAGDRRGGRVDLSLGSCPFREAVARPGGHLVCALHRGLVEGVAAAAQPGATVPEFVPGDPFAAGCRVSVSAPPDRA